MNQAYLFNRGLDYMSYQLLGARPDQDSRGRTGYRFTVWAPKAKNVSVVGTFNDWHPDAMPLEKDDQTGLWTGFSTEASLWDKYKYAVTDHQGQICLKADPFARHSEMRPANASILYHPDDYSWQDTDWMRNRPDALNAGPLNIYEVHLGSWRRNPDGSFMNYREIGYELSEYVTKMGYTAVELLPVMEHPLDESWGYQVTGFYSVTSRFGTPADFKHLVDTLHNHKIHVILDWVPAHFPRDAFGLARFDGTSLFEHPDTRLGEQAQWGTYVFDFGKLEVRSFLISNAWFWLHEYHADGLRFDAVSSMLYLNFGRSTFLTNPFGGVENLDAIAFLKQLNGLIREKKPACFLIAEESSTWPGVTQPIDEGGLGFTHKWNMGWMNDTLNYMTREYNDRRWHHHELTFSMTYAFSERFILPMSHDEVVHGKGSLMGRMPGDYWQKFAGLRTLFTYQITHPGSKLLFMGCEFGPFIEWRYDEALEWFLLSYDQHRLLQDFVCRLNHVYRVTEALWSDDHGWDGFRWLNADDAENSVYIYSRHAPDNEVILVILNMKTDPVNKYAITSLRPGCYSILVNSDDCSFGGSGYLAGRSEEVYQTTDIQKGNERLEQNSPEGSGQLVIDIPPLSGLILKREENRVKKMNKEREPDGTN